MPEMQEHIFGDVQDVRYAGNAGAHCRHTQLNQRLIYCYGFLHRTFYPHIRRTDTNCGESA